MISIKKFEQLSKAELYEIIVNRINVFVVEQNCPYADCDNLDQQAYHLLNKKSGEIISYLRIIPAGLVYNQPVIGRVLVKAEYRKQKIASKMLTEAINFIKTELQANKIKLSAQEYVLNLYRQLGFQQVSDCYLEDGIPHYEMQLEL